MLNDPPKNNKNQSLTEAVFNTDVNSTFNNQGMGFIGGLGRLTQGGQGTTGGSMGYASPSTQTANNQEWSFGSRLQGGDGGGGIGSMSSSYIAEKFGISEEEQQNMDAGELKAAIEDSIRGKAFGAMAPNILRGAAQTGVGLGGLLTQGSIPEYEEPERLQQAYQDYGQIAEQGLPEVNAAAQQRMSRQINTGRQEAMDAAGPSTANAITAATTSQNLEGQRQIAEMEADQMLKGLQQQSQIAQTLRQIQDRRTQAQRQRYGQEEAAFGKAAQSGMGNLTNALNLATGIANAKTGGLMGLGSQGLTGLLSGGNNKSGNNNGQ